MKPWDYVYYWWHERKLDKLNDGYDFEPATPELTARRFKQLFNLHGIEESEIPEIKGFEDISLYDLNSNDRLLQKLTPDYLHKIADLFGVRIEWLRSGEPTLYQHRNWYKSALPNFFEDLKEIDFDKIYDPFFIVTTTQKFDVNSPEYQPFILVLRKHLSELGDKDLFKYYFESVWDWHHPPCRLQAKGIATQYYKLTGRLIDIYQANIETFHKIKEGYIPPLDGLWHCHNISFEEYGALKLPHMEPYEKDEWDAIIKEMEYYKIDSIKYDYLKKDKTQTSEKAKPSQKATAGRKPSKEKQELKDRFVFEYEARIKDNEIKCAKAAREFFLNLKNDERVLLFRSAVEYETLTYEEALVRALRTLTDYYADYKKNIN